LLDLRHFLPCIIPLLKKIIGYDVAIQIACKGNVYPGAHQNETCVEVKNESRNEENAKIILKF
jgi:hypothetical protein